MISAFGIDHGPVSKAGALEAIGDIGRGLSRGVKGTEGPMASVTGQRAVGTGQALRRVPGQAKAHWKPLAIGGGTGLVVGGAAGHQVNKAATGLTGWGKHGSEYQPRRQQGKVTPPPKDWGKPKNYKPQGLKRVGPAMTSAGMAVRAHPGRTGAAVGGAAALGGGGTYAAHRHSVRQQ